VASGASASGSVLLPVTERVDWVLHGFTIMNRNLLGFFLETQIVVFGLGDLLVF